MDGFEPLGEVVAFVPSMDLHRSREFYAGVLGLTIDSADDFALVISAGTSTVRVTAVQSLTPQPFTVLGWTVADLRATVSAFVERGVEFSIYDGMGQDDDRIWASPSGALVAWFRDPDGNTLSLTQPS